MQTVIQEFWRNDINHCLRSGKLVYVDHPKCASTYYSSLLKSNGWQQIKFKDIDWASDQVFGFFMHPKIKHAKAVTEDLQSRHSDNLDSILKLGESFFQDLGLFGWHSMPLWLRVGDHLYNITWIPLDGKISSDELLKKYLAHHGTSIEFVTVYSHRSNAKKQKTFELINQLLGDGSAIIWQVLAKDLDLYNHIVSNLNYYADDWTEIYGYRPQQFIDKNKLYNAT
jgi:hypothetical protein